MEDFINRDKRFSSYLCIDIKPKSMNEMTDKQRAARKLASDYSRYLFDQENLVERIMERKWQELSLYIEDLIDNSIILKGSMMGYVGRRRDSTGNLKPVCHRSAIFPAHARV